MADTFSRIAGLLLIAVANPGQAAVPAAATAEAATGDLVRYTEQREPCRDRNADRNAYFGDLHIHTGYSYDARPQGVNTTPEDAYRFARGEAIPIPPYDENGKPQAELALQVPLDFAAVTDHAEFLGELTLCSAPGSTVADSDVCRGLLGGEGSDVWPFVKIVIDPDPERIPQLCGEDGAACRDASVALWRSTQTMAEAAYDRSANCEFTTFIGYEHTGTANANNNHRNVIFRNHIVPEYASSYIETPTDRELWNALRGECLSGLPGCDVLAIPHNSNISAGAMFPVYSLEPANPGKRRELARERNAMEPLMEIFQHKGNSECFNGLPNILGDPDELCNVEQVRSLGEMTDRAGQKHDIEFCAKGEVGRRGFSRVGCISSNDFFRSVLLTGLQDEAAIGINSYRLGVIASTDTHLSLAGATDEASWPGHLVPEADLPGRLATDSLSPRGLEANPGGLAGVWAVENSRDALFEALRRREVFGTSGTRIRPRLFGGWSFAENACDLHAPAAHGYRQGVPMGGELRPRPDGVKPHFLAFASRDPNGAALQKLQLIKGWVDSEGQSHYRVLHVAGTEEEVAAVDPAAGNRGVEGSSTLCTVFEDTDFEPGVSAYYYLRAVEVPTQRWSWAQCARLPAAARPVECSNDAPKTTWEMAWTSPIWYVPEF